ncbi:MAG: hypothetical protein FJ279_19075, partial [Planctomycetes bacterium]|nr:hypothetical protein [Planctomycetota bacterium]
KLNSRVTGIALDGDRVTSVKLAQNGEIACDYLIATIPLPELVQMLRPPPEARYLEVARRLGFRSIRFLNILINRPQVSDNTWIYVPETDILFFRVQEPKNWSPQNAPEGKTSLILEIACNVGDAVWSAPDDEIYRRCCADLNRMGFDIERDTIRYFSTRVPHGYPVYDLEYRAKLSALYELTGRIRNLICCGRQGLFRYNNMDHSMKMGFLAADHVLRGASREAIFRVGVEASLFEYDNVLQETRPEPAKAQSA